MNKTRLMGILYQNGARNSMRAFEAQISGHDLQSRQLPNPLRERSFSPLWPCQRLQESAVPDMDQPIIDRIAQSPHQKPKWILERDTLDLSVLINYSQPPRPHNP